MCQMRATNMSRDDVTRAGAQDGPRCSACSLSSGPTSPMYFTLPRLRDSRDALYNVLVDATHEYAQKQPNQTNKKRQTQRPLCPYGVLRKRQCSMKAPLLQLVHEHPPQMFTIIPLQTISPQHNTITTQRAMNTTTTIITTTRPRSYAHALHTPGRDKMIALRRHKALTHRCWAPRRRHKVTSAITIDNRCLGCPAHVTRP